MTVSVPLVDLKAQYARIGSDIDAAIRRVIESSGFILGPEVDAFEESFAQYCGVSHCVGVASGTSALELTLRAYGVGLGDEVITVAHTFIATAEAISAVGAIPGWWWNRCGCGRHRTSDCPLLRPHTRSNSHWASTAVRLRGWPRTPNRPVLSGVRLRRWSPGASIAMFQDRAFPCV